jgi:hypothetical protein
MACLAQAMAAKGQLAEYFVHVNSNPFCNLVTSTVAVALQQLGRVSKALL